MRIGRRLKQTMSLDDWLKIFSGQLKEQASKLQAGPEQEALLKRARIADTAAQIDKWANSPGLQPPKWISMPLLLPDGCGSPP